MVHKYNGFFLETIPIILYNYIHFKEKYWREDLYEKNTLISRFASIYALIFSYI